MNTQQSSSSRENAMSDLDDLLAGGVEAASTEQSGEPLEIAIEAIREDETQPRRRFTEDGLNELATTIEHAGVVQPIVVYPADTDGYHRIAFGARRFRAAQRAGLATIPAHVRAQPSAYAQVIENVQREDLSPLDIAAFIEARLEAGESKTEIAHQLGKPATWVSLHAALIKLPGYVSNLYDQGQANSVRVLYTLAQCAETDPDATRAFCERVAGEGAITVRDAQELQRSLESGGQEAKKGSGRGAKGPAPAVQVRIGEALATISERSSLSVDGIVVRFEDGTETTVSADDVTVVDVVTSQ